MAMLGWLSRKLQHLNVPTFFHGRGLNLLSWSWFKPSFLIEHQEMSQKQKLMIVKQFGQATRIILHAGLSMGWNYRIQLQNETIVNKFSTILSCHDTRSRLRFLGNRGCQYSGEEVHKSGTKVKNMLGVRLVNDESHLLLECSTYTRFSMSMDKLFGCP